MTWQPIETIPAEVRRESTKIYLHSPNWPCAHKAVWDLVASDEGDFGAWHLEDEDGGAMGDGMLWPDEDHMPTQWSYIPEDPPS